MAQVGENSWPIIGRKMTAGALGLGQVLINSAVLSVAFLAAGAAVVALGRRADWWG